MTELTDHKNNGSVIAKLDAFVKPSSGNLHLKSTTCGWELLVEWKDGSDYWVPLKDLKQSNPVELTGYAMANEIIYEHAFNWYVKDTLQHRDRIISKVKSNYWCTSHKFVIQVPKTVKKHMILKGNLGLTFEPRLFQNR